MSAYLPSHPIVALGVAAAVLATMATGFVLARRPASFARPLAWAATFLAVAATHACLLTEGPGFRMLALIAVGLTSLKGVVLVEARRRGMPPMRARAWLAFVSWPGMRPQCFVRPGPPDPISAAPAIRWGIVHALAGTAILGATAGLLRAGASAWVTTPLLLVSCSLVLHFGICSLLVGLWRHRGILVDPIFRSPWRAQSLGEFWSRRWNLAFSQMTSHAVYRPVAARFGRGTALVAAFAFSGVLHEMAISLPVDAGYGGPMAYFGLHALAVALERALHRWGIEVGGAWGRAWTFVWLVVPLPLLFHEPFVAGVLRPLVGG